MGDSDDEGSDENEETESNSQSKPVQCAAGCGKDAQVDSIYCSVECILKHAMKVPNKDAAKKGAGTKDGKPSPNTSGPSGTPRGDDIPPLETAPPDEPPPEDDSRSDEDFVPEDLEPKPKSKRDKKIKKEQSSKRSKSKSKEIKSPPPKSPKAHKKLTDKDIDDIMARVAGMKDEEPIMVMRYGALLTGVAAPRKNNLRKFLEENRVGAKVMLDDKPKSDSKQNPIRRRDDLIISNRNRLEKAKRQAERARPIQPVAPIIRESPKMDSSSKSTLNPYARKEENRKATEKKEKPTKKEVKKGIFYFFAVTVLRWLTRSSKEAYFT